MILAKRGCSDSIEPYSHACLHPLTAFRTEQDRPTQAFSPIA